MIELGAAEARRLRARAQLIGGSSLTPAEVVSRAVALQGQDLGGVLRAIAVRSAPGTKVADVRTAFDAGEIVRGWPMRGTLFATTLRDLAALHSFTRARQLSQCPQRHAFIELSEAQLDRAREVSPAALADGPLSREELFARWADAGVEIGQGHGYHLVFHLSTDGVLHYAGMHKSDQRIALTPVPEPEDPDVALTRIARGFFAARGPATIDDLAWWTKLPKALLRKAVDRIEGLEQVSIGGRVMRYLDDGLGGGDLASISLVPAFDEWVLGYQDRSLIASDAAMRLVATVNGIFRPAVLKDGVVIGIWREPSTSRRSAEVDYLGDPGVRVRKAVDRAIEEWRSTLVE